MATAGTSSSSSAAADSTAGAPHAPLCPDGVLPPAILSNQPGRACQILLRVCQACLPRHMMPCNSRNKGFEIRVVDLVSNVCLILLATSLDAM